MRKLAWLLLILMLAFGGYRIWDRNAITVPPEPVAIEQVQPIPEPLPPVVQPAPAPAPVAKPAQRRPRAEPVRPSEPPKGGKPKAKAKPAPEPAVAPPRAAPARTNHVDRGGADNGASSLPVSCATIRWYASNAPALGRKLAATYNPTAAQIAAANACLKK